MILQKASSQHILRLLWCSCRSLEEHLDGSTSQFSSDSYRALMNSPGTKKVNNAENLIYHRQCAACCSTVLPARSHGNSYIFYKVANSYEFVWPHSYKFIRFLLNRTYFTSCQFVWICTNDLHLTPPLNLPVTGV